MSGPVRSDMHFWAAAIAPSRPELASVVNSLHFQGSARFEAMHRPPSETAGYKSGDIHTFKRFIFPWVA